MMRARHLSSELEPDLLDLPAPRSIRLIGRWLLALAESAHGRLRAGDDAVARRDFDLALRRLHDWLGAWRDELRESAPGPTRRALREMRRMLRATAPNDAMREALDAQWVSLRERLDGRWIIYQARMRVDGLAADPRMSEALADRIEEACELSERNAPTTLRDLLAPIATQEPVVARTLARLRASEPGAEWPALVDWLRERAAADVEIERKYLLHALPPVAATAPASEIAQGYLPGRKLVERLRHVRGPDGEKWFRTVKLGTGMARTELEEESSRAVFDAMWPLTLGRRLTKRRHYVREGAHTWEIDDFTDRDLVLAEIELRHESDEVVIPTWLVPYLVREVTGEGTYQNSRLAR